MKSFQSGDDDIACVSDGTCYMNSKPAFYFYAIDSFSNNYYPGKLNSFISKFRSEHYGSKFVMQFYRTKYSM